MQAKSLAEVKELVASAEFQGWAEELAQDGRRGGRRGASVSRSS